MAHSEPSESLLSASQVTVSGAPRYAPGTATATREPTVTWDRLHPAFAVLFMVGAALAALGIVVMNSRTEGGWALPALEATLRQQLASPHAIAAGLPLLILGTILSGLTVQRVMPDFVDGQSLPAPRFRSERVVLGALVVGALLTLTLWVRLVTRQYAHVDIAIFFASLVAFGYAFHRSDPQTSPSLRPKRLDLFLAALIAVLTLVLHCVELAHWNFAWIGDEGAFFDAAQTVLRGREWNFFDLTYVYGAHPMADTVIHALGMWVGGESVIGWRLAEVVMAVLATVVLYALGTTLFGRLAGVAAATVTGSSHYVMAWERGGYNNTHQLFYVGLAVLMLALAWRTQRQVFVYLTGVATGLCLYTFASAAVIWPILALSLLLAFLGRPNRAQIVAAMVMLAAFALVITPGFLTTPPSELLGAMTTHSRREQAAVDPVGVARANLITSNLVFWVNEQWHHHFMGGTTVDRVTGLLTALGIGASVFGLHRRGARLALLWYALGIAIVASTFYVAQPPLTRLLFVIPAAGLLAGLTVTNARTLLERSGRLPPRVATGLLVVVIALIPVLNLHQLLVESPKNLQFNRFHMIIKALQEHPDHTLVVIVPVSESHIDSMVSWYPWFKDHFQQAQLGEIDRLRGGRVNGRPPMFLVPAEYEQQLLGSVSQQLQGRYQLVEDWDPAHVYRTHLFVPTG